MCYFLYIASPLTLSEIRSMLPPGVSADLADLPIQQVLRVYHPGLQTVARLLIGRCSCGFVRSRDLDRREDERHLRKRYRDIGVSRPDIIAALERHRRGENVPLPVRGWPRVLMEFVAEHARNAGPTLYLLSFSPSPSRLPALGSRRTVRVPEVVDSPESWLVEGSPTLAVR